MKIRAVNWHLPFGEIDILAEGRRGLVLVEVRGRTERGWKPVDALSYAKRRRLARLAEWLQARRRVSVGVVLLSIVGKPPRCPAWVVCRWPRFFGLEIKDYEL